MRVHPNPETFRRRSTLLTGVLQRSIGETMLDPQQVCRQVRSGSCAWNQWRRGLGLTLLAATLWLCPIAAHAQPWIPTDIGAASGIVTSNAQGVNDLGQVTGTFTTAGGQQHAFLWNGLSFVDLGTLGGTTSIG